MIKPAFFTTSLLPAPEALFLRGGRWQKRIQLRVRVGYFHHPMLGHTLVDTGYGPHVTVPGQTRDAYLSAYRLLIRPSILNANPLVSGLARFGVHPDQINTVILSHFHADHVGGMLDLPNARVLCSKAAWEAVNRSSRVTNAKHGVFASILPKDIGARLSFVDDTPLMDAPFGLGQGWDIAGDGRLLAIDLPGHLNGHIGLCFPQLETPFLYAVDVQWLLQAVVKDRCPGIPASLVQHDGDALQNTVRRVREFAKAGGDIALCHAPEIHAYDADPEVGA